jgi:hypothetical protein
VRILIAMLALATMSSPTFAQTSMGSMGSKGTIGSMGSMGSMSPKCKSHDPVVWINTRSKVYYTKGSAYYGKTSKGKYACTSDALAMGAHAPGMTHKMTGGSMMSPSSMASPGGMHPTNPQPSMGITSPIPHMSSSPSP